MRARFAELGSQCFWRRELDRLFSRVGYELLENAKPKSASVCSLPPLCGLEIDDELQFRRLLDREVATTCFGARPTFMASCSSFGFAVAQSLQVHGQETWPFLRQPAM